MCNRFDEFAGDTYFVVQKYGVPSIHIFNSREGKSEYDDSFLSEVKIYL